MTPACTLSEARTLHRGGATSFALMITDMVLPDGRGIDLANEVRRSQPELPVLCMSGYADGVDGIDMPPGLGRLQKPFSADELLLKVRALLDQQSTRLAVLSA